MLSEKQIRSMISVEYEEGQDDNKQDKEEQVLDLSHKQLRRLREIELRGLEVQKVNASYNFFKDFSSLNFKEFNQQSQIPIRWLDLSFNYIRQIDESALTCHALKYLRYLNVSANQIQSVDFTHLELPLLQTLNLNSNKLKYFLHAPENLKVLSLNDNMLTSLAFTGGLNLNMLTAKKNKIKNLGLQLSALWVFDIEDNKVEDIYMIKHLIQSSKGLMSINLRDNPVCKAKEYKIAVLENCQQICQIDEVIISPHIREGFQVLKAEEQLNKMLDQVNLKYQAKLKEKQKIKQELVKKIRDQEKVIQANYQKGIQKEKQHFQLLEKQANAVLAKNKLGAPKQKGSLTSSLMAYADQLQQVVQTNEKEQRYKIQKQNYNEYLEYMNKKRPYSSNKSQKIFNPKNIKHVSSINQIPSKFTIPSKHSFPQSVPEESQQNAAYDHDLAGIELFDDRAIDLLVKTYDVNELEY